MIRDLVIQYRDSYIVASFYPAIVLQHPRICFMAQAFDFTRSHKTAAYYTLVTNYLHFTVLVTNLTCYGYPL